MANKQIADEMFETFQQGSPYKFSYWTMCFIGLGDGVAQQSSGGMPRDRFEKLLEQHCKRVIRMVEGTLLPMAEHNRDRTELDEYHTMTFVCNYIYLYIL